MFYKKEVEMSDFAIKVDNVTKIYKLYDKPIDRLKEMLDFRKKVIIVIIMH